MAPGRFQLNFRSVAFKLVLVNDSWGICFEITLRWLSLDLTDDKWPLVLVNNALVQSGNKARAITAFDIKHLVNLPIGHMVLKIYMPCKNFHVPSQYLYKPCKAYVYCWENKYMPRLKSHLPSQARNHKSLCALGQDLHAQGMRTRLNVEPCITWANVEPVLCRHKASLGHSELRNSFNNPHPFYKFLAESLLLAISSKGNMKRDMPHALRWGYSAELWTNLVRRSRNLNEIDWEMWSISASPYMWWCI